jgi:hypothetical protein
MLTNYACSNNDKSDCDTVPPRINKLQRHVAKTQGRSSVIRCQWQSRTAVTTFFHHFFSTNKKTAYDTQTVQATRPNSMTLTNKQLNLSQLLKKNGNFPRLVSNKHTADGRDSRAVGSYMNCYLTFNITVYAGKLLKQLLANYT